MTGFQATEDVIQGIADVFAHFCIGDLRGLAGEYFGQVAMPSLGKFVTIGHAVVEPVEHQDVWLLSMAWTKAGHPVHSAMR